MKRGLGFLLGALTVVLAFGVLGPIGALAVAWFVLSPDAVAATARGGGAGAVAAAAAAAGDYLAHEWRAGGPARQRRRTERRDRWWEAGGWPHRALALEHALVIAGRAIRSSAVATARAAAVVPAGAKAGAQAAREHRARRTTDTQPADTDPAGTEPGDIDLTELDEPAAGTGAGQRQSAPAAATAGRQERTPGPGTSDSGGRPATGQAPPAPTGDGMTQTDTTSTADQVGGSELTHTGDLRAEVIAMQALIEEAEILGALMQEWQAGLPDAYESGHAAGGPKTKALDEAVAAVSEAGADGAAFGDALGEIRQACDQADSLGEHASSMGADGHTRGYATA